MGDPPEPKRELELYLVMAHPNNYEYAKGYAAGLEDNSMFPFTRYEARQDPDCPLDMLYIQRYLPQSGVEPYKGWERIK